MWSRLLKLIMEQLSPLDLPGSKHEKLLDLHGSAFKIPDYTVQRSTTHFLSKCFERNVFKSMSYLIQDLVLIIFTFYTFKKFVTPLRIPSYPCALISRESTRLPKESSFLAFVFSHMNVVT